METLHGKSENRIEIRRTFGDVVIFHFVPKPAVLLSDGSESDQESVF